MITLEGGRERMERTDMERGRRETERKRVRKKGEMGVKNGWTGNIHWYVLVHHELSLEEPPKHWTECINRGKLGD